MQDDPPPSSLALAGTNPACLPGLSLRPIIDADAAFLYEVYASTRADELAPLGWPEAALRQFLAQQFDFQHRHYQQAYAGADFLRIALHEVPIGRLYVDRGEREICVLDIALLPAYRGRGIGSSLLAEIQQEARDTRRDVTLHVETGNPAYRWYLRLGFRQVENRGVYDFLRWSPVRGTSTGHEPDASPGLS